MYYRRIAVVASLLLVGVACNKNGNGGDDAGAEAGVAPTITGPAAALPDAEIDAALAPITLTATGDGPITWSLDSSSLPPGLTLDASAGTITGTPTTLGTYTFTVRATNASGSDTRAFTHEVVPPPADAHLLVAGNQLIAFNLDYPGVLSAPVPLSGMLAGETLVSIDRRPQNGMLYALGVNATNDTFTLYAVATANGTVTPVQLTAQGFTSDGATVVDLPTTGYAIDFNPAADRLRVTAGSLSFRVNANNGAPVDGNNGFLSAVTGTNPDGSANGATTSISGVAYTNNFPNNGNATTLYTISADGDALYIQNPPNAGTQTLAAGLSQGVTSVRGFDILPDVTSAANSPAASGSAYAVVTLAGQLTESIVRIDLTNGAVADATTIASASTLALAVQRPASLHVVGLAPSGPSLVRFSAATPGTVTTQPLAAPVAGETFVALDFRPHTGQLYALGINHTLNTGTLYVVDPQSGAYTLVGTMSQIALVDSLATPVDFPDPATVQYGMDFNPAVDRIRVVTASGLSFRVNPSTGAPVALDGGLNGSAVGAGDVAYTNDPGPLTGGTTTAYVIDGSTQQMHRMSVPNAGSLIDPLTLTSGGNPLSFSGIAGFDIPTRVSVTTANAPPAEGTGYAGLVVAGTLHLFAIDLVTGSATDLGAVGSALVDNLTVGMTDL